MKKRIIPVVILFMLIFILNSAAAAAGMQDTPAAPINAILSVDGQAAAVKAYVINGTTYYKLRGVASLLAGTSGAFQVIWNEDEHSISITTGCDYVVKDVVAASESIEAVGPSPAVSAVPNTSPVYFNGVLTPFTAFTIDGANYFNLEELARCVGFGLAPADSNGIVEISIN